MRRLAHFYRQTQASCDERIDAQGHLANAMNDLQMLTRNGGQSGMKVEWQGAGGSMKSVARHMLKKAKCEVSQVASNVIASASVRRPIILGLVNANKFGILASEIAPPLLRRKARSAAQAQEDARRNRREHHDRAKRVQFDPAPWQAKHWKLKQALNEIKPNIPHSLNRLNQSCRYCFSQLQHAQARFQQHLQPGTECTEQL